MVRFIHTKALLELLYNSIHSLPLDISLHTEEKMRMLPRDSFLYCSPPCHFVINILVSPFLAPDHTLVSFLPYATEKRESSGRERVWFFLTSLVYMAGETFYPQGDQNNVAFFWSVMCNPNDRYYGQRGASEDFPSCFIREEKESRLTSLLKWRLCCSVCQCLCRHILRKCSNTIFLFCFSFLKASLYFCTTTNGSISYI